MKRLRSQMIAAFLGLVVLAIIPLSIIPYYALSIRHRTTRSDLLDNTIKEMQRDIDLIGNDLNIILYNAQLYMQADFPKRPKLIEVLETSDNPNDFSIWKEILWRDFFKEPYNRWLNYERDFSIIPKKKFLEMESWLEEQEFYEDEQGRIYLFCFKPLWKGKSKDEMEIIGGLFAKITLIEKQPGQMPVFRIQNSYDAYHTVIDPSPSILRPYLPPDAYERLYDFDEDGRYEEIEVDDVQLDFISGWESMRMQTTIRPVINQRGELAAVMILAVPIVDLLDMIGLWTMWGAVATLVVSLAAAVLMARYITKPINELAATAAHMTEGHYDVRVQMTGTYEQQVLCSTFNQLADRIQNQLIQLQSQTKELEESNRELYQTHHFLQNILAHIHTGVMSLDSEGRISHINRIGMEILQIQHFLGQKLDNLVDSNSFGKLVRYSFLNCRSLFNEEIPYQLNNGETRPLQISTVPLLEDGKLSGLVVTFHDLSSIRKLEEQLRRQDRLASLGRMAAGVAHEIRNPLGIIRGSAELLKKRFGGQPNEEGLTDFIVEEVNRLSRVVTDFLMFARPPVPTLEEISVETLLENIITYVQGFSESEKFHLSKEIEPELPPIAVDEELFRQAFLNLWLNAQQAMPEGGTIVIRAQKYGEKEIDIEIKDEGEGIPPNCIDRIFDPFYTSKDNGTGLGLSLVHQIVDSHNGRVEVESVPGQGSIFRIILSAVDAPIMAASGENL